MNKIVREHYPVRLLPEDLRAGLDLKGSARVTIEEHIPTAEQARQLRDLLEQASRTPPIGDDAVERIRRLRDEWDD